MGRRNAFKIRSKICLYVNGAKKLLLIRIRIVIEAKIAIIEFQMVI